MARYQKPKIIPFQTIARTLRSEALPEAERRVAQFARAEMELFKRRIKRQEFIAFITTPLSHAYLSRKIAAGADSRVMIATGRYLRKIKMFRRAEGSRSVVLHIGFPEDALAFDMYGNVTGFHLWEVALVQEHGSAAAHIPARPHWGPHRDEMAQRAVAVRTRIVHAVVTRVRSKLERLLH